MTNGEMIQKVFDCEVCEPLPEDDIIHVIFPDKNDSAIGFDWSWWKMEYIDPTAKNNLGVDCISRAEAIRVASGYCHPSNIAKELAKLPPITPQEPKIKVLDNDEVARKLGTVDIYKASAWIALLKDLEYLGMKICEDKE